METSLQKQITVIMSPGQIPQSRKKPETLTPLQQTLRNGSTASQLVDDWSGTQAQLNCNLTLAQAIRIEGIPTLADINVVFGNATSVRIITEHLQSILRYAGIDIAPQQLAETALSILASYYFSIWPSFAYSSHSLKRKPWTVRLGKQDKQPVHYGSPIGLLQG